jgi:hypothetical protein
MTSRAARPFAPVLAAALAACGDDGTSTTSGTSGTSDATSIGGTPGTSTDPPGTTTQPGPTTTAPGTTEGPVTTGGPDPSTSAPTTEAPSTGDDTTSPVTATTTGETTVETSQDTTDGTDGSSSTGPAPCAEDTLICDANTAKVCDGLGGYKSEEVCPEVCVEPIGCVACVPGEGKCEGQQVQVCNDAGTGYENGPSCDPLLGLACDPNAAECTGPCANLGFSYIGCEYYPVVTQQLDFYVGPNNPYAVAVANASADAATVTIFRGNNMVGQPTMIPAGSVKVINLPWVTELTNGTGPTVLIADGAYHLRSTRPVTVYQFNPVNADVTNDASLMLPVNTWTGNYLVAAWQHWSPYPGFYSVTAMQDGTTVTVKAPKGGMPTQAGAGVNAQGNGVVMLNQGDVLQVTTGNGGDLTGTIVTADKPVQVLGGHDCTQVPIGTVACDHLEEAMFPIEALAKEYIVVPPVQVPNSNLEKAVRVRVVASEDNTNLVFTPDQPVAKVLAKAGDFVELANTTAKFVVTADKKILVAEYMVGQGANFGTSDPAMLLAVPSEQFRTNYLFYAQTGWQANFVDIIAPTGAAVQVDGAGVNNFSPIGNTGFSLAHVALSNAGDGSHNVTADQKVGISVYGVVNYGSYWYPGGLDLDLIPQ